MNHPNPLPKLRTGRLSNGERLKRQHEVNLLLEKKRIEQELLEAESRKLDEFYGREKELDAKIGHIPATIPDKEDEFGWKPEDEEKVQHELWLMRRSKGKDKQRSPNQVILDRAEVSKLIRRGYSTDQIAEKMEVPVVQVCHDLDKVLYYAKKYTKDDAENRRQLLFEQYSEIKKEAWEAWERSKLDAERSVREVEKSRIWTKNPNQLSTNDANDINNANNANIEDDSENGEDRCGAKIVGEYNSDGGRLGVVKKKYKKTKEGRNPSNEYLRIIMDCLKAERDLLGIDAPKNINVKGTLNWDILINGLPDNLDDEAELKLAKEMGYAGKLLEAKDITKDNERIMIPVDVEARMIEEAINGPSNNSNNFNDRTSNETNNDSEYPELFPEKDRDYPSH